MRYGKLLLCEQSSGAWCRLSFLADPASDPVSPKRFKSAGQAQRFLSAHDQISDLAELFSVSRPTVYRTLGRQAPAT
jgi:hypothetical protein